MYKSVLGYWLGIVGLSLCFIKVHALDENPNFCVHPEPLLLIEIEKQQHFNNGFGASNNRNCTIEARLMTENEKERFIDVMCKDHGSTRKDNYEYFKLNNGDLIGRGSYNEICKNITNPLLAWIPYRVLQSNYAHELNPKDFVSYIAKATNMNRARTELCHFRHSDLVNNIDENLFACIVMIFEDNYFGIDDNINVLVEIQPLAYEIRNVTYSTWRNVTNSYKTKLGQARLKNMGHERKPIYGSLSYSFVEKLKLNLSSVYGTELKKLPILLEYKYSLFELDNNGAGGIDVQEKAYFGRNMDPKSEVKVDVIGQWAEQRKTFSADLYEYFSFDVRRFKQTIVAGDVVAIRIDSTEPVFETVESQNLAKATLYWNEKMSERLTMEDSNNTSDGDGNELDDFDNSTSHPYPGFYPWFVLSCLVLALAVVLVIYGIVRTNSKKHDEKHKYELTTGM